MSWTRGPNGMENSKNAIDMGGLCENNHLVVVVVVVVVVGEWRTSQSDVGTEAGGGYSSEMRTVTGEGKQKSMTSIDANLTPDFRYKEESNNIICIYLICKYIMYNTFVMYNK